MLPPQMVLQIHGGLKFSLTNRALKVFHGGAVRQLDVSLQSSGVDQLATHLAPLLPTYKKELFRGSPAC